MAKLHGMTDLDHEFKSLRLSALKNAVEIAPYVTEITLGPEASDGTGLSYSDQNGTVYGISHLHNGDRRSRIKEEPLVTESHSGELVREKILHECELRKRETADVLFNNMLNKMAAKRTEMMTKFWNQQELEYERRSQERRNREIEMLREWALGDKIAKIEQEKIDEENRAHSERMRKLLERQLESTKLFESLNRCHAEVCTLYKEITNISTPANDVLIKVLQKLEPSISFIFSSINAVTERCNSGTITSADVDKATSLANRMRELKSVALEEFNIATTLEASSQRSTLPQEVTEKKEREIVVASSPSNSVIAQPKEEVSAKVKYCSEKSLKTYIELKLFLTGYQQSYASLLEDNSLKKFRFDLQKAVNTPVNAISSVSGAHLKDKFDKLSKLLNGERVRVGDTYISCSSHPQGIAYCTDLLARKIVRQGDLLVSSSPDAAFPIASVTIALWARFPDLGKLIMAHFHQVCPYLIPMMVPQCQGQSDEDYYKMRGYKYSEEGTVEKQDQFLKRMSGIFRLCAAIWVTEMPSSVNCPHPHGLAHAWRWMAAFINLDPEADLSATLLYDFLTVCGSEFSKNYRRQFIKVLNILSGDFLREIEKIDEGGPKTRLEVFLQTVHNGSIPPPAGILPNKIW